MQLLIVISMIHMRRIFLWSTNHAFRSHWSYLTLPHLLPRLSARHGWHDPSCDVDRTILLQEGLWGERCAELMSSVAFNPSGIPSVAPSALCDYLGLTSTRQLYIALMHLPCVPVGIWYRTDSAAQPEGELVSVYATGRGVYKMSPLDHSGGVLKQIELMRTDLCTSTCARHPRLALEQASSMKWQHAWPVDRLPVWSCVALHQ